MCSTTSSSISRSIVRNSRITTTSSATRGHTTPRSWRRSAAALHWMGGDFNGDVNNNGNGKRWNSHKPGEPHKAAADPLPLPAAVKPKEVLDETTTASWGWKSLNLKMYPEVKKYLSRDEVVAVDLPEMVIGDKTYPGLILDGASGVGKTQQAFALLNDGNQQLVYFLLIDGSLKTRQDIYQEMTSMTGMPFFLRMVDAARKVVLANTEQSKDPFSSANLFALLNSKIAPLDALIHFIADRILKYDKDQKILSMASTSLSESIFRFIYTFFSFLGKSAVEDSINRLNGTVLFLDEVLPPCTSSNEPSEDAPTRLRFVRNLGRALKMRVVMAGTAATAANMITLRSKGANDSAAASREGEAERGWMEIEFLWIPLKLPALLGLNSYTKHAERPYLRSLLEVMPQNPPKTQLEILEYLAKKIAKSKGFSNDGKLIWLSGCWLASEAKATPSPFAMGPADLVKGHFFEPALAMASQKPPYMGVGASEIQRLIGPLRILLQRHVDEKKTIWWVLKPVGLEEGYSEDFEGIESALTYSVQSCLASEPVLAVSVSMKHSLSPEEFSEEFHKLWKESPQLRSLGGVDWKLNEFLMFAALQMACRAGDGNSFPNTRSVEDMVERLWEYLLVKQTIPPADLVKEVREILGSASGEYDGVSSPPTLEYSYGKESDKDESYLGNKHSTTKMPWLVPACSIEKLKEKIEETRSGERPLFHDMNIAGLVPGRYNSNLDASAYLWEGADKSECAPLEWMFEFISQTESLSLEDATDALVLKCDKPLKDTKDKPISHAMLVAITGNLKSECRIWLQENRLRIVLLIGNGLVRVPK